MRYASTSLIVLTALLVFPGPPLPAITQVQSPSHRPDSTTVFGSIEPTTNPSLKTNTFNSAFGLNVMVSTNGFGLGFFYRRAFSDVWSGVLDLAVSEARDEDEKEFTDIYGRPITIGKVNRFLVMPVFLSIERRFFKD